MSETTPSEVADFEPDSNVDFEQLVTILEDERIRNVVKNAIQEQRDNIDNRWQEYDHIGFEAADIGAGGWEFKKLMKTGALLQTYKSNNSSYYRLGYEDEQENFVPVTDTVEKAVELAEAGQNPVDVDESGSQINREEIDEEQIDALFSDVVGREKEKKWFRRTINKDKQVHHLLVGTPGSGKSMILDDIANLPGAERVVFSGNQSTAQGVVDTLVGKRPKYLIVEEVEKGSRADREALMTLCGQGYIQQTKGDSRSGEKIELDTIVFAAGNQQEKITPEALVDRFTVWEFEQYTHDEFVEVCQGVLPRKENVNEAMAEEVANTIYEELGPSVRDAKDVAGLVDNTEEINELVELIS
jgi:phosphosulfolactate synthase (CoM biosynthesis protein A)